jgi:ADP-heptose:LPS heptosyltransferase
MLVHDLVDRVVPLEGLRDGLAPPLWTGPPPDVAVNLHGRGPQSHRTLTELSPRRLVAFRCDSAGFTDGPSWTEDEHEVERWCRLVLSTGVHCSPDELRLVPPETPLPVVERLGAPPVVVHPGAASLSRRWPAERWAAVARALVSDGWPVVVTGGPAEQSLCQHVAAADDAIVDLGGRLDLGGLASIVARARLVLCGDTGVAHVATAYGTPSVLLFGPTPPDRWGPLIDRHLHRVLWRPLPGDPPGDPHGRTTDVRLDRIAVESVLGEAHALLAGDPPSPLAHRLADEGLRR